LKRLLFVCTRNRLRSATAEAVFSQMAGVEAIGAGTNADAPTPASGDLIEWADLVFVMEPAHRTRLSNKFGSLLRSKRVIVLGIPDDYGFMDPELVRILRARVSPYLV
jgi:predicted protein tyrosine phosphatase